MLGVGDRRKRGLEEKLEEREREIIGLRRRRVSEGEGDDAALRDAQAIILCWKRSRRM